MILAIYGTGGLGKETCFLAEMVMQYSSCYTKLVFIDDTKPEGTFSSYSMLPFECFTSRFSSEDTHIVLAVGEPANRKILREKVRAAHYRLGKLVSPDLQKAPDVEIGEGCLVFPGSVFLPGVSIRENTVIQSNVTLTHDDRIGKDSVISPHSTLGGAVTVGDHCYIGLSSVIRDHINIGADSIVGMGAVVTKDVEPNSVVVGNPAKKIRDNITRTVFHK